MFLEDWKIESIYEDEDGLEFYDDLALEKIKKGISLKAQGYSDEQIIAKLSRMEAKIEKNEEPAKPVQPLIVSDLLEENTAASAMQAAKLRFRAVMMTNIAFILGLLPLVFAHGAGAGSRHSIGVCVFGGMLAVAFLGNNKACSVRNF